MKFEVDGVNYEFVESPTFGEARSIEKVTGASFAAMSDPSKQSIDLMQALVWISMKRTNPDITFDDLDDLDMGILGAAVAEQAEEPTADPTTADVDQTTSATSD